LTPLQSNLQPLIAPVLQDEAKEIEKRSPGITVLGAREFRYPVQQLQCRVAYEIHSKLNLLQRFVLRAYEELVPPPSPEELAAALGLDPIFIITTLNDLLTWQLLSKHTGSITLTEEGRKTLLLETRAQESHEAIRYMLQDALLDTLTFEPHPFVSPEEPLENLETFVQQNLQQFTEWNVSPELLEEVSLDLHRPEEGQVVTEIEPLSPPHLCWKRIGIFVLRDEHSNDPTEALSFLARSEGVSIPIVATWLLERKAQALKELCGLEEQPTIAEEASNPPEAEEMPRRNLPRFQKKVRTPGQELPPVQHWRGAEIRPAFLQALRQAREEIIIYSPWINEHVVDDEFLALIERLVKKGVHFLIGYGIGREEQKESRPIPPGLQQRLRAITTLKGAPGVIVEWLGNSHAKEVIIDRKLHISGSHNWLSYRGDFAPRDEIVYRVAVPTEVERAHAHIRQRFLERAQYLWSRKDDTSRTIALSLLGYLGYEQMSLDLLERERCHQYIPLWITLVHHAVLKGHDTRIIEPLKRLLTGCYHAIAPDDPLKAEINEKLQQLGSNMKRKYWPLLTEHAPIELTDA